MPDPLWHNPCANLKVFVWLARRLTRERKDGDCGVPYTFLFGSKENHQAPSLFPQGRIRFCLGNRNKFSHVTSWVVVKGNAGRSSHVLFNYQLCKAESGLRNWSGWGSAPLSHKRVFDVGFRAICFFILSPLLVGLPCFDS